MISFLRVAATQAPIVLWWGSKVGAQNIQHKTAFNKFCHFATFNERRDHQHVKAVNQSEKAVNSLEHGKRFSYPSKEKKHNKSYKIITKTAESLIYGERLYQDFTVEEIRIVDKYQEKIYKFEGGFTLPNTHADLEERKLKEIIEKEWYSDKNTKSD